MNRALDQNTGLRWLAVGACAVFSLLLPHCGMAQSDNEALADFRACGAVERDRARLACFDGVLAAEQDLDRAAGLANPDAIGETRTPDLPDVAAAEAAVVANGNDTSPRAGNPDTLSVAAAEASGTRNRGDSPLPSEDSARRAVTIVETQMSLRGNARFVTDDGRVYVQTRENLSRQGYPSVPFEAALENGAFGSLFLVIGDRLRVRVRAEQ